MENPLTGYREESKDFYKYFVLFIISDTKDAESVAL